ncbi:MAG: GNAT family N-acetyltransferase [Lachnospiraceae bacterium]|nr:GNAT family N-acetyltransferase [Lachnospiraceae bacterium]
MKFRKLEASEHEKTRSLYEEVFSEDEASFVNYYYQWKTKDNQIYVAEEEQEIHAMVHLNPCEICWNGTIQKIDYIVAVATRASSRHQGLMRRLLELAMHEMYAQKRPFVFLMPASEAIYTPFGFHRTWNWQWEDDVVLGGMAKKDGAIPEVKCSRAGQLPEALRDLKLQQLSDNVNACLSEHFTMFSWRSPRYYRDLEAQQKAGAGELQLLYADREPVCSRCTIRESFPPMMSRIIHLPAFIRQIRSEEEQLFCLEITDPILSENNGLFEIHLTTEGGTLKRIGRPGEAVLRAAEAVPRVAVCDLPGFLEHQNPFQSAMICEVV